ncbi:hypothetical protein P7C70_g1205, partial [Phenoliferia sp. Uapishka_3]
EKIELKRDAAGMVEPSYVVPKGGVTLVAEGEGGEVGMSCAVVSEELEGATPGLMTDDGESSTRDGDEIEEDGSDEDTDDDADFEEVMPSPTDRDIDDTPSFSISFRAPPPEILPPTPAPIPQEERRKGFDPDEEYGMNEDDEDGEDREGKDEEKGDEGLKEKVDAVFETTMRRLGALNCAELSPPRLHQVRFWYWTASVMRGGYGTTTDVRMEIETLFPKGVSVKGVRTHLYLKNESFGSIGRRAIMYGAFKSGIIKPSPFRIVEGSSFLERCQYALDEVCKGTVRGEKLVVNA